MKEEEEIILEEESGEDGSFAGKNASAEIKKLKEKLETCEAEKREYLDGWQRAKADFMNARKEEETRREDFIKFANRSFILQFLDLADSFDRAMANRTAWEAVDKNWRLGVEYIYGKLMGILKSQGVESFDSVGLKLDPAKHEAVGEVPIDTKEKDGIIVEESAKGYTLSGSIIRPARVKVGKYEEQNNF